MRRCQGTVEDLPFVGDICRVKAESASGSGIVLTYSDIGLVFDDEQGQCSTTHLLLSGLFFHQDIAFTSLHITPPLD